MHFTSISTAIVFSLFLHFSLCVSHFHMHTHLLALVLFASACNYFACFVRSLYYTGNFLKMFILFRVLSLFGFVFTSCKISLLHFPIHKRKEMLYMMFNCSSSLSLSVGLLSGLAVCACVTWGRLFSLHLALRSECE